MNNNATFDKMLTTEGPLTLERFVEINWDGLKTVEDLEEDDWSDVCEFESWLEELGEDE